MAKADGFPMLLPFQHLFTEASRGNVTRCSTACDSVQPPEQHAGPGERTSELPTSHNGLGQLRLKLSQFWSSFVHPGSPGLRCNPCSGQTSDVPSGDGQGPGTNQPRFSPGLATQIQGAASLSDFLAQSLKLEGGECVTKNQFLSAFSSLEADSSFLEDVFEHLQPSSSRTVRAEQEGHVGTETILCLLCSSTGAEVEATLQALAQLRMELEKIWAKTLGRLGSPHVFAALWARQCILAEIEAVLGENRQRHGISPTRATPEETYRVALNSFKHALAQAVAFKHSCTVEEAFTIGASAFAGLQGNPSADFSHLRRLSSEQLKSQDEAPENHPRGCSTLAKPSDGSGGGPQRSASRLLDGKPSLPGEHWEKGNVAARFNSRRGHQAENTANSGNASDVRRTAPGIHPVARSVRCKEIPNVTSGETGRPQDGTGDCPAGFVYRYTYADGRPVPPHVAEYLQYKMQPYNTTATTHDSSSKPRELGRRAAAGVAVGSSGEGRLATCAVLPRRQVSLSGSRQGAVVKTLTSPPRTDEASEEGGSKSAGLALPQLPENVSVPFESTDEYQAGHAAFRDNFTGARLTVSRVHLVGRSASTKESSDMTSAETRRSQEGTINCQADSAYHYTYADGRPVPPHVAGCLQYKVQPSNEAGTTHDRICEPRVAGPQ
ncbi:hypothetical protein CSUI_002799 [Cystoisospora suis]|uniref:Uncharacterized protein n=1 Tax=Cystoisospora suis TaxID=483139 RepID=A0A2C6L7N7_9APIC|nr:hypothetical protein CSUI_002799 [Cystoisospora suis]